MRRTSAFGWSGAAGQTRVATRLDGWPARTQIAERTRRGKRHRAKSGSVNVLSGAPYGYRYIKKTDTTGAYYQVIESEATTVCKVFELYTRDGLSINAIAHWLNEHELPTRRGASRWCRSTVWAMLRNPAYRGRACFGKTEQAKRRKMTRPLRQRGGYAPRNSANRERPREEWIDIAVPPIVSEAMFELAHEQLEHNKRHAPRRTIEPTLLQGMLVCNDCGYAYYRTSTRTSKRKLYYYRCLGSDDYRYRHGRVCHNPPVRQDHLEEVVWPHIIQLLEHPTLIQTEINRRIAAAKQSSLSKRRKDAIDKELTRIRKGIDNLLDAYQEGLLELKELRARMPALSWAIWNRRKPANRVMCVWPVASKTFCHSCGYPRIRSVLPSAKKCYDSLSKRSSSTKTPSASNTLSQ